MTPTPTDDGTDQAFLAECAGLAYNVATILLDREGLDGAVTKSADEVFAIIRANITAVYDLLGRDIDLIEEWIEDGTWTAE